MKISGFQKYSLLLLFSIGIIGGSYASIFAFQLFSFSHKTPTTTLRSPHQKQTDIVPFCDIEEDENDNFLRLSGEPTFLEEYSFLNTDKTTQRHSNHYNFTIRLNQKMHILHCLYLI